MNNLPARFLRITASKNQLLRRLERLRTSKAARHEEGHVLVQGIKTLQELAAKGHRVRTIGITFDEHHLPIRASALDIAASVQREDLVASQQQDSDPDQGHGSLWAKEQQKPKFMADQYVAVSRKMTTRILGTDSPTAEHEVWAEVAIPDYSYLFSVPSKSRSRPESGLEDRSKASPPRSSSKELDTPTTQKIRKLVVLDQISDPGNMGLMIRSAKALFWDAGWLTPGTVDPFNNKVVRASRALCLDWPLKNEGRWEELERFLDANRFTLVVADMLPRWAVKQNDEHQWNPHNLVWWNWPSTIPRTHVPENIALVMSSEHHGVRKQQGDTVDQDLEAKTRLLRDAIRVSIPMNPAVESMNVAAAATAMMWELNRILDAPADARIERLQILDAPSGSIDK
ncbi:hypothetical protein BG011_008258 [Mortierella polycephala]|uniref:tRNA/rRNA methyltransferase SpoU type domain-containing protein n=1 Tax=Mortierella polycephala TaxID=41804 RepID=A0A9P6TXB3_9FUNG|nr:hypothetical protein BG011_008258 [Mortierella polycephala]